jgi:hypothetical protein
MLGMAFAAAPAAAVDIPVGCDPDGSDLVAAIDTANATPAVADDINLDAGCTYSLSAVDNFWYGPNGLPEISSDITINGNGATIERTGTGSPPNFRLIFVGPDPADLDTFDYSTPGAGILTLRDLTLSGGMAKGGNSGFGGGGAGMGGAIFNQGDLTLSGVTVSGNSAVGGLASGCFTDFNNGPFGGGGIGQDATQGGTNVLRKSGGGFGGAVTPINGASTGHSETGGDGGGGGGFRGTGDNASGSSGGGPNTGLGGSETGASSGNGSGDASSFPDEVNATNSGGGFGQGGQPASGGGVGGGGGGLTNSSFNSIGAGGGFGGGGARGSGFNPTTSHGGGGGFGGGGGGGNPTGPPGFGGGGSSGSGTGGGGAGMGGAIFNMQGELVVTNSTLTANTANGGHGGLDCGGSPIGQPGSGLGGAIFNLNGDIELFSATIAANIVSHTGGVNPAIADTGPGLYNLVYDAFSNRIASVGLNSSILADGTSGSQLVSDEPANTTADSGANDGAGGTHFADAAVSGLDIVESQSAAGSGTITGTPTTADPMLGALAPNGGPTMTMEPASGSPALDGGNSFGLTTDQRGLMRPFDSVALPNPPGGDGSDIGAFELQGTNPASPPGGSAAAPSSAGQTCRGRPATIVGTAGPDILVGTSRPDVIQALGGDDVAKGLGAGDTICGGADDDRLKGGGAPDTLVGGPGSDLLLGGKGKNTIFGGSPTGNSILGGTSDRCPRAQLDRHQGCVLG